MEQIRRRSGTAAAFLLLLTMLLLAQHGTEIAAVLRERILLCLRMLIPSLYGCTAAALRSPGFWPRLTEPPRYAEITSSDS